MKEWHIIHECDTENGTQRNGQKRLTILNMVNMYGLNLHIITLMT